MSSTPTTQELLDSLSPAERERHRVTTGAIGAGPGQVTELFAFFDAEVIRAHDVPTWRAQQREAEHHG